MINDNATTDEADVQSLEWQVEHLHRRYDEVLAENHQLRLEIRRLNEILNDER